MRNLSAMRYPILLLALLCASCGTALPSVKPYKLDVQQGNVVTSKMLLQLRPGMTQSQVRFIMGTPLIQDSFHGKRWDYVYQMRENGKITEQRRVILDFEKDVLKTVRGDVIPSTTDASKSNEVADNSGTRVINPSAKAEDKSLFGALKFWKKEPVANPAPEVKAKADEPTKQPVTPAVTSEAKPVESKPLEPAATPVVGNPESQSVLAVPLLPAEPSPVAATQAPVAAVVETPAAVTPSVESTSVESASVEAAPVQTEAAPSAAVESPAAEPVAAEAATEASPTEVTGVEASSAEPLAAPAATPAYESPSGMQFERNLSKLPEDIAPPPVPEPAPVVTKPPAASTELPKAKELPVTAKPSFFDRMLEKIGF
jgi:outer membrane protein assembly factor BamE